MQILLWVSVVEGDVSEIFFPALHVLLAEGFLMFRGEMFWLVLETVVERLERRVVSGFVGAHRIVTSADTAYYFPPSHQLYYKRNRRVQFLSFSPLHRFIATQIIHNHLSTKTFLMNTSKSTNKSLIKSSENKKTLGNCLMRRFGNEGKWELIIGMKCCCR